MKYIQYLLLAILSIALMSCGGGGSGGGSISGSAAGMSTVTIAIGQVTTASGAVSSQAFTPAIPSNVETIQIVIKSNGNTIVDETFDVKGKSGFLATFQVPDGNNVFQAFARDGNGVIQYVGSTTQLISGPVTVTILMTKAGFRVFVSNADSDNISAINPIDFDVRTLECSDLGEINCSEPRNLAAEHGGNAVFVPFRHSDNVMGIDGDAAAFDKEISSIGFDEPYAVAFSCDNSEAWVANKQGGGSDTGSITIIDTTTNLVTTTLSSECLSSPEGIAIANDKAYIANRGNGTVCIIDVKTKAELGTISVGGEPRFAVATPDGKFVYVSTDNSSAGINKIDTSFDELVGPPIPLRGRNLAVTPDGKKVYVGTQGSEIGVIDVSTDTSAAISVPEASSIYGIAVDSGTGLGFATDEEMGVVFVFDSATDTLITDGSGKPVEIPVGSTPRAITAIPGAQSCEGVTPPSAECDLYVDQVNGGDFQPPDNPCTDISQPCETITWALGQTEGNQTICVAAGTYDSQIESFPIKLKPGTTLLCQGEGHSSIINSNNGSYPEIAIYGAAGATVDGCRIEGGCVGIDVSADMTITNNVIENLEAFECANAGIYVNGGNPDISNNTIFNNNGIVGILVDAGSPVINDNVLSCNEIDLRNETSDQINAQNNSWDHVNPTEGCTYHGEDICNAVTGSVDFSGAKLALSPCQDE